MGFFGSADDAVMGGSVKNENELMEQYIYDELSMLTDEDKKAFLESSDCQALLEKGLINRKTMIRLNKNDDLARRTKMAAFQLAKEHKDPLWTQLVKNRIKERMLIRKIATKYSSKASIAARRGQRDYLKHQMGGHFVRPTIDANDRKDSYNKK